MAKQSIAVLLEVDEDGITGGDFYTLLPERLDKVLHRSGVGVSLTAVYLVNPQHDPDGALEPITLNYHHYAVSVRGEKCVVKNCEQHPQTNLLDFNDQRYRQSKPPGIN